MKPYAKVTLCIEFLAAFALSILYAIPYVLCGFSKRKLLHCAFVALCAAMCVLAVFLLLSRLWKKSNASSRQTMAILSVTLLVGVICGVFLSQPLLPKHDYVAIDLVCGTRSESTEGYEAWLSGYYVDEEPVGMDRLPIAKIENMEYVSDGDAYWYHNADGSKSGLMRLYFKGDRQQTLVFAPSHWSGVVQLINRNTGSCTELDLSKENDGFINYSIPRGDPLSANKQFICKILLGLCAAALMQFVSFAILCMIRSIRIDARRYLAALGRHSLPALTGALLPLAIFLYYVVHNRVFSILQNISFVAICGNTFLLFFLLALLVDYCYTPLVGYIACVGLASYLLCFNPFSDWLSQTGIDVLFQLNNMTIFGGLCSAFGLLGITLFRKKDRIGPFFLFAAVFVVVFLGFNMVTVFTQNSKDVKYINSSEYAVEPRISAEKPNVYWLHLDGMLGFSTFEEYYGDAQTGFQRELNSRGFSIDKEAAFDGGHRTSKCMPALLCPSFYDAEYMAWESNSQPSESFAEFYKTIPDYTLTKALYNCELFNAFHQIGYQRVNLSTNVFLQDATLPSDRTYLVKDNGFSLVNNSNDMLYIARLGQTANFMKACAYPLYLTLQDKLSLNRDGIPVETVESDAIHTSMVQTLSYSIDCAEEPAVFYVAFVSTHYPFVLNEDGVRVREDTNDPMYYPAQHVYTTKVMLCAIDTILEKDPDAVIVLQGDHGLHGTTDEEFIEAFGKDVHISDFQNHVMSAIRIPEKYQNGEEKFALASPLNITRYLINNFVGRNYTYITQE